MQRSWTTKGVPQSECFAVWREEICRTFVHLSPRAEHEDGFAARIRIRQAGPLMAADIVSVAQTVKRRRCDIAASPGEFYFINIQMRGHGGVMQGGNDCTLAPGQFAVLNASMPFEMRFEKRFHQVSLKVPHTVWRAVCGPGDPVLARAFPGDAVLARRYTALIDEALSVEDEPRAARILEQFLVLLATLSRECGLPAADPRLETLREMILRNLTDAALSPGRIASDAGLSVRTLHTIFEGSGDSFAGFLRTRRVELAGRLLRDPAYARHRIIEIAFKAGFNDLSTFARAFKRRFGTTPLVYRKQLDLSS